MAAAQDTAGDSDATHRGSKPADAPSVPYRRTSQLIYKANPAAHGILIARASAQQGFYNHRLVALRLRHFAVTDNAFQALTILFPVNLCIAIGSRVSRLTIIDTEC